MTAVTTCSDKSKGLSTNTYPVCYIYVSYISDT